MSEEVDLIRECAEAGVVFHPKSGKLRPALTYGPVDDDLRRRVETKKEALLLFFVAAFDWSDFESGDDATLEANFSRGENCAGVHCHAVSDNVACGSDKKTGIGGTPRQRFSQSLIPPFLIGRSS